MQFKSIPGVAWIQANQTWAVIDLICKLSRSWGSVKVLIIAIADNVGGDIRLRLLLGTLNNLG